MSDDEEIAVSEEGEQESPDDLSSRPRQPTRHYEIGTSAKEHIITEGLGMKLGEMENVAESINSHKANSDALKKIHSICYGRPGKASEIKSNLRQFRGLVLENDAARLKVMARINKWVLDSIKECMDILDIPRGISAFPELEGKSPAKEKLIEHFVKWLQNPQQSGTTKRKKSSSKSKSRKKTKTTKSSKKVKTLKKTEKKISKKIESEEEEDDEDMEEASADYEESEEHEEENKIEISSVTRPKASTKQLSLEESPKSKKKPPKKQNNSQDIQLNSKLEKNDIEKVEDSSSEPTTEELRLKVDEILSKRGNNFDTITFKQFSTQVEEAFGGVSLAHRKAELKALLG